MAIECCLKRSGSLVVRNVGPGNHLPGFLISALPLTNYVTLTKPLTVSVPYFPVSLLFNFYFEYEIVQIVQISSTF